MSFQAFAHPLKEVIRVDRTRDSAPEGWPSNEQLPGHRSQLKVSHRSTPPREMGAAYDPTP